MGLVVMFDNKSIYDTFLQARSSAKHLLVIDAAVEGYPQFVLDLDPSVAVVVLPDDANGGMAALADALAPYNKIDSLHLLSHGGEGSLFVAGQMITADTLPRHMAALREVAGKIAAGGDILLYGCSVAHEDGRAFVDQLARLTGKDVAASDDLTGPSVHGGDYILEYQTGPTLDPLLSPQDSQLRPLAITSGSATSGDDTIRTDDNPTTVDGGMETTVFKLAWVVTRCGG